MPTALATLPSNRPIPNGRVQILRGVGGHGFNFTSAAYGEIIDTINSVRTEIQYTPTYPCFWVVKGNLAWQGASGLSGGVWNRNDMQVAITPADADGRTSGAQCPMEVFDSGTVLYVTWSLSSMFRLSAGTAYTAYLSFVYSSGNTAQCFLGQKYSRILGKVIGEGRI